MARPLSPPQSLEVSYPLVRQLSVIEVNPEGADRLKTYADNWGHKSFLEEGSEQPIIAPRIIHLLPCSDPLHIHSGNNPLGLQRTPFPAETQKCDEL